MNPIKYLHENGVKRAIKVLYDYKLELFLERVVYALSQSQILWDSGVRT